MIIMVNVHLYTLCCGIFGAASASGYQLHFIKHFVQQLKKQVTRFNLFQ